jgi:GT2 family glycosyltransferase
VRDSLVICTADRPADLERCLASVACQIIQPDEIVIIDASADESTTKVVQQFTANGELNNLRIIRSSRGLTSQRNRGLRETTGDIVHFLDDDVEVCRDYFQRILAVFTANPGGGTAVGASGVVTNMRPRQSRWLHRLLQLDAMKPGAISLSGVNTPFTGDPDAPYPVGWLSGCSMSYRRSAVLGISFNEDFTGYGLGEDVDFSQRAGLRGLLLIAPGAYLTHHESLVNREDRLALTRLGLVRRHEIAVRRHPVAGLLAFWLSVGAQLVLLAIASVRRRSREPFRAIHALAGGTGDILRGDGAP